MSYSENGTEKHSKMKLELLKRIYVDIVSGEPFCSTDNLIRGRWPSFTKP